MILHRCFILNLFVGIVAADTSSAAAAVKAKLTDIESLVSSIRGGALTKHVIRYAITAVNKMAADPTTVEDLENQGDNVTHGDLMNSSVEVLDEYLLSLLADVQGAQRILDNLGSGFASCRSYSLDADYEQENASNQKKAAHEDCRIREQNFDKSSCWNTINYMNGIDRACGNIEDLGTSRVDRDTWKDWLDLHTPYWANDYEYFTAERGDPHRCKETVRPAWIRLTEECHQDQWDYETAFCQWRQTRISRCTYLTNCWGNTTTTFHSTQNGLLDAYSNKPNLARMVYYARCLLINMVQDETNLTLCDHILDNYYPAYQLNATSEPTKPGCDTTPFDVHPGTGFEAQWQAQEYASLHHPTESPIGHITQAEAISEGFVGIRSCP